VSFTRSFIVNYHGDVANGFLIRKSIEKSLKKVGVEMLTIIFTKNMHVK